MPDENTNPVGTTQTSQNDQNITNQSENDFVLDFGDLGDDNVPSTKEVQVDSSLAEEKADDEISFDIDLGSDDQNGVDGENVSADTENSTASDVSIDVADDEKVNDFDISMGGVENEETMMDNDEAVLEDGENSPDEGIVQEDNEIISEEGVEKPENEEINLENNDEVPENDEIIQEGAENISNDENIGLDGEKFVDEENISNGEGVVLDEEKNLDEEIIPDQELSFSFTSNAGSEAEDSEIENGVEERHLFKQVDENNQDEANFDVNISSDSNEMFQANGNLNDKQLFVEAGDTPVVESVEETGGMSFDLQESSNNSEGLEFDIKPEEQKQPEIGDLLGNSPVDLSKELNDTSESGEFDSFNVEIPVGGVETGDEINSEEVVSEQVSGISSESDLNETASEVTPQELVESGLTSSVENNKFLLDEPQAELEAQNVDQISHQDATENNLEVTLQGQSETDERSEMVNNAASEMSEKVTPEINISTPVEFNDVNSNQTESIAVQSENQVQSTLSLDQILDTELSSNPQYSDNSKASPQNVGVSSGKGKMGLLIGAGVAALACCVAVLAFPSIGGDRKPGDTVEYTGTIVENPVIDEPYGSAPDESEEWGNPLGDLTENSEISDYSENPDVGGGHGSASIVSFPDDVDDSGDTNTGPVPYVWSEDGQNDEPGLGESVVEEIDKNQVLDVILSFKSQAEGYYSYAEQSSDNQLMKYSLRLINLSDNYIDKVNNGEGIDSESLSNYKSTANKIINKIDTYLGGDDEDVQVIREATIGGESNFEGKDELKEYIYNNR